VCDLYFFIPETFCDNDVIREIVQLSQERNHARVLRVGDLLERVRGPILADEWIRVGRALNAIKASERRYHMNFVKKFYKVMSKQGQGKFQQEEEDRTLSALTGTLPCAWLRKRTS
jgi:hypothetical protein